MKRLAIFLLIALPLVVAGQEDYVMLKGRVTSGGRGVPYATLQLMGTSTGVSCNDAGEYELKVPAGHEGDTVLVRSVGYEHTAFTVGDLKKRKRLEIKASPVVLEEVTVSSYRSARHLLNDAIVCISHNFHQQTGYSTFFARDWRAVDDEMYLFDEAVMMLRRSGYTQYADKHSFKFYKDAREMSEDYKSLLKHRLLVNDWELLVGKTGRRNGAAEMLEYADNENFYDPVYAPQASILLAERVIKRYTFGPVMEFEDNGEKYYRFTATNNSGTLRYEYTIHRGDLAIVQIKSVLNSYVERPPNQDWVNIRFNRLIHDADSSIWTYGVREGHYTLTRYYNYKEFRLCDHQRDRKDFTQRWQMCLDWTLTDFSLTADSLAGDTIAVQPQTVYGALGESRQEPSFWGRYNSVVIDTMPLRLFAEKMKKMYPNGKR